MLQNKENWLNSLLFYFKIGYIRQIIRVTRSQMSSWLVIKTGVNDSRLKLYVYVFGEPFCEDV